ncbi:MAG: hypothetical protein ACR2QF_12745 [Geminicoccaceae bacterium]
MTADEGGDAIVEKLMSISRAEFESGLKRLAGSAAQSNGRDDYLLSDIGVERQTIRCAFEPLPEAVLGTLLKLPRARVTLHLTTLSSTDRTDFLTLFDRTFQRGGG